ncbi:MAG: SUMF1/EgtB/PvdO family nonheme iron enzyme [Bacteroidota bacterium]
MTAPRNIADLKQELKESITSKELGVILQDIKQLLSAYSPKRDDLIHLEAQLNDINRQFRSGALSFPEQQREYAKVRTAIMLLIDQLNEADFGVQGEAKSDKKRKQGSILYRIPQVMQLHKESKCLIRLAFLEEIVRENIVIDEDTRIQSIRIAEVMGVQLLDASEGGAFSIRTYSEPEQFLDEDDCSEWIFYVKPFREGVFPLMLKVAVIEEVRGKERKRSIELEESIEIVTAAPEQDVVFQAADYHFSTAQKATASEITRGKLGDSSNYPKPASAPAVKIPKNISFSPTRSLHPIRRFAPVIVFLLIASVGAWALDAPREINWQLTQLQDTPEAYEEFIEKYEAKGENRIEKAYFNKAKIAYKNTDTAKEIKDYQEYLDKYEASGRVAEIEKLYFKKVLEVVSETKQIDPMTEFLTKYNRNKKLEVRNIAKKKVLEVARVTDDSEGLQAFVEKVVRVPTPPTPEEEIEAEAITDEVFEALIVEKIVEIKDKKKAVAAAEKGNTELLKAFIEKYPESERVKSAKKKLEEAKTTPAPVVEEKVPAEEIVEEEEIGFIDQSVKETPKKQKPIKETAPPVQEKIPPPVAEEKIEDEEVDFIDKKVVAEKVIAEEAPAIEDTAVPIPEMVSIKGGIFTMGCEDGRDTDCDEDEKPAHQVQIKDFSIGKYEVTNLQYAYFLNDYGSDEVKSGKYAGQSMIKAYKWGVAQVDGKWQAVKGYEGHPVVYVSWYGANEYAKWLSQKTVEKYRLPTEAEWEYAARGGQKSQGFLYAGSKYVGEVAWHYINSEGSTHKVGTKKANELGLYDMSGNVYEWCSDCWYDDYKNASKNGTSWLDVNKVDCSRRVLRGGSWDVINTRDLRSADRFRNVTYNRYFNYGFRLAQD